MLLFLIICFGFFLGCTIMGIILLCRDTDFIVTGVLLAVIGFFLTAGFAITLILFIGAGVEASFYNNLYGTAYTQIEVFFNGVFIRDYLHGTIQNINIDGLKEVVIK